MSYARATFPKEGRPRRDVWLVGMWGSVIDAITENA